jgi:DNA-binding transcriptional MerR regulator
MQERYYKISEVSEILGIEPHTLRYLENTLKLKIKRNERGDRLYTESNMDTIRLVLELKDKGLNTTAIKMALENIEDTEETGITAKKPENTQLVEFMSISKRIVEQNEELIEYNKKLEKRMMELERKIEQRNEEREKKIADFLNLWKAEQEGKNKSWLSKLWGK